MKPDVMRHNGRRERAGLAAAAVLIRAARAGRCPSSAEAALVLQVLDTKQARAAAIWQVCNWLQSLAADDTQ